MFRPITVGVGVERPTNTGGVRRYAVEMPREIAEDGDVVPERNEDAVITSIPFCAEKTRVVKQGGNAD